MELDLFDSQDLDSVTRPPVPPSQASEQDSHSVHEEEGAQAAEGGGGRGALRVSPNRFAPGQPSQLPGADLVQRVRELIAHVDELVPKLDLGTLLNADPAQLMARLRDLFNDPSQQDESSPKLSVIIPRIAAVKCIILWATSKKYIERFQGRFASHIMDLITPELETFPHEIMGHLASQLLKALRANVQHDGQVYKCLPIIWQLIATSNTVVEGPPPLIMFPFTYVPGKSHKLLPLATFQHLFVKKMCSYAPWNASMLCNLCVALRDADFRPDELTLVVEALLESSYDVNIESLPQVVYQLLMFSEKGCHSLILEGISKMFQSLDERFGANEEQPSQEQQLQEQSLRHIEGDILAHIGLAVKRDSKLTREFLYLQKSRSDLLKPFDIALLLLIMKDSLESKQEEEVLSIIRKAIAQSSDQTVLPQWLSVSQPSESLQGYSSSLDVLRDVLKRVQKGWVCLAGPLVTLALSLMDHSADKNQSGVLGECGAELLLFLWKTDESLRLPLLDALFTRFFNNSPASKRYAQILAAFVQESAHSSELISPLKDLTLSLHSLAHELAAEIVAAMGPLLTEHPHFLDHVLLTLRKAVFAREMNTRIFAVKGVVAVLQALFSSTPSESIAGVAHDVLGFLQRSFSQQRQVRSDLYAGLASLYGTSPQLRSAIARILLQRLVTFVDDKVERGPLKLSMCIEVDGDNVEVSEPLPDLFRALVTCATFERVESMDIDDVGSPPPSTEISERLATVLKSLLSAELEDFGLDQTAEYSLSTLAGRQNQHMAILLLRIYEALIEHVANAPWDEFRADVLGTLFNLAARVKNDPKLALKAPEKEKSKAGDDTAESGAGRRKGRAFLAEFSEPPHIHLTSLYRLVEVVCLRVPSSCPSTDHVAALQHSVPFCVWVESAVHSTLVAMHVKTDLPRSDRTFAFKVGQLHLAEAVRLADTDGTPPSRNSLARKRLELCCDIFAAASETVVECSKITNVIKYASASVVVSELDFDQQENDRAAIVRGESKPHQSLHRAISQIEGLISNWLETAGVQLIPLIPPLLRVVSRFVALLPPSLVEHHTRFLVQLCAIKSTHAPFVSTVLRTLLDVSRAGGSLKALDAVATDVFAVFGSNDSDLVRASTKRSLPVVQDETVDLAVQSFLAAMDVEVEAVRVAWLARAKSPATRTLIVHRVTMLVRSLSNLAGCALSDKAATPVLQMFTRVFKLLTIVVKDNCRTLSLAVDKSTAPLEELVSFVAKNLSTRIYSLFPFLQNREEHVESRQYITREMRVIPSLIAEMEKFEGEVIKFSAVTGITLYANFKRSTARDFRIVVDKLNINNDEDSSKKKKRKKTTTKESKGNGKKRAQPPSEDDSLDNSSGGESSDEPRRKKSRKK